VAERKPIIQIFAEATTGKKIAMLRLLKGYSQQKLAEKAGYSKETIYAWENNRRNPSPRSIRDISRVLGVAEEDLA
jgi:transcriptional regulator with XRE-family HTH domain